MADKTTWIKIDRNIERWRWYQDANTMRVFLHLLLNANISDHDFQLDKIHRGQLVTSYDKIAVRLGITYRQARTAVEHLKSTQEVAVKQRPKYLVISIVNYDEYQSDGRQKAGKRQADGRQTATIKEYKEIKKERNIYTPSAETDKKAASPLREDYGGVWLTDDEYDELEALVEDKDEFLRVLDRVGEWLADNPRAKSRHKATVKTFLRNDGLI